MRREYLQPCALATVRGWKGAANYFDVVVGGDVDPAAARYYPEPKAAASHIRDHVAFWNGVEVDE